ncbi:MAG: PH domain-containing protein [Flavobacteriales bacterium]|nr:PH domain-containing protein [Flavobacteriales bacterium]
MEEKVIWQGSPSQWMNFAAFVSCILIIPIPFVFWKWLKTKFWKFEITNERLTETTGVLSKSTDELELYRVKDIKLDQPFLLRLVGLSNIRMATSDRTHPVVLIPAISGGKELREQLRKAVEDRRDKKKVRETDFE